MALQVRWLRDPWLSPRTPAPSLWLSIAITTFSQNGIHYIALLLLLLLLLQPFYDPLFGTTQVSRYQKDKPFRILLKQTLWGGGGIS